MRYDVAIIGAGLNGISMAALLAKGGLKIALIDKNEVSKRISARQDGRGIAVSRLSKEIFIKHDIWQSITAVYGTINDIVVTDADGAGPLRLSNILTENKALGHIVEHDDLLAGLYNYVVQQPNITLLENCDLINFVQEDGEVTLELTNKTITAKLMVAADGKNSKIRDALGITYTTHDYNQSALVFTIWHEKPHKNIAYEHFRKGGPFAVLPLNDSHHSSVVWTEQTELANIYAKMPEEEQEYFVQEKARATHGKIKITSKVFSYPLSLVLSKQYYNGRVVLIGDSLHFIHPIAGQGFNLSLRDISCLSDLITRYHELGLDIGSPILLEEFVRTRKKDNYAMVVFTDLLNKGFSNKSKLVSLIRRIGLDILESRPKLQSYLLNYSWVKGL